MVTVQVNKMAAMTDRDPMPAASDRPSSSLIRTDPFVGNVSKVVHLPKDYSGSVRRGHLEFDAAFESGNLGRVDWISDFEYDLFVRPDTCNPRYRVWFYFKVSNIAANQRVIFNIVNFSKTKSLYRDGMTPLVKSTSRPKWQRIPCKNVFYYKSPDHNKNYVLSFAFAFDKTADTYQFAYCYPYTYTRLQAHLGQLDQLRLPYYTRELIGYSVQQRRLDLVTITSPKNLTSEEKCKVVFVTARVHPGETPSSYVCQGMMDYLVCNEPSAEVLRDNIIFKIAPMLNPDGVYLGNYRCSLMGFDLNRHWHDPSPWAHPTLTAAKQLLSQYDQDPNTDLVFYIDIHSHSTLTNGFMYGNIYEDADRRERHALFPKLFSSIADDFSLAQTSFNQDPAKAGTGRRFLGNNLDSGTNCYTLEVSFFSYQSMSSNVKVPYDEQAYLKLGRNLARTLISYYDLESLVERKEKEKLTSQS